MQRAEQWPVPVPEGVLDVVARSKLDWTDKECGGPAPTEENIGGEEEQRRERRRTDRN